LLYEFYDASFPSERIGVLKIGKSAIIQVYLPFNDRSELCCENFNRELIVLETAYKCLCFSHPDLVIVGDFNCDFSHKSENCTNLVKKLRELDFGPPLDLVFEQQFEYTYWKIRTDKIIVSWPDHVFSKLGIEKLPSVELLPINNNFGDHRGIGLQLKVSSTSENNSLIIDQVEKLKLFWGNGKKCDFYSFAVSSKFKENEVLFTNLLASNNKVDAAKAVNEMNAFITDNLVASGDEHMSDLHCHNSKPKKKWWGPALQRIHVNICIAYKNYKASNFSNTFKAKFYELKKQFRIHKRLMIKLKSDRNLQIINKYFSLSKDDFWKKIKQISRSSSTINVPIETLKKHYEDLFNVKHNIKPDAQVNENNKLEENKNKFSKAKFDYMLDPAKLNDLILDLPNGKACGLSNLTYEHIKHCSSFTFLLYLSKMYETMVRFSVIPENFNVSILKPLIKDPKASSETTDNLRPVAISEVLANLFEKLLLWELKKRP
jgi:hypothetical protein